MNKDKHTWVFFGTSEFSFCVLEQLKEKGFLPSLIVTVEDKPKGRKLLVTPPATKVWADREGIPCIQPMTLKNAEVAEQIKLYSSTQFDFFVVASYGKILPQAILDIPRLGVLNVHPSLLPKLRGASPIESAILHEDETGVTIIRLDAEMDHGPIVAQEKIIVVEWPPYEKDLEKKLGISGGQLLAHLLPDWLAGKIKEIPQNHDEATRCGKIEKQDAELLLTDPAEMNLRKIRAYHAWPGAYFFYNDKRIVIREAHIENGDLKLDRIVPEGKKEMSYDDFMHGQAGK